jgi:hypothetical protein
MSNRPRRDDIFVVEQPFETVMTLYWRTPSIEERQVTLPEGLEMKVIVDPTLIATSANLQPTDINAWEPTFLSAEELKLPMYGGYAFAIPFTDLRSKCRRVDR